jgi:hypothetical protein
MVFDGIQKYSEKTFFAHLFTIHSALERNEASAVRNRRQILLVAELQ